MNEFNKWYAEADMPTKSENGMWYDAEDGRAYKPAATQAKTPQHESLSAAAAAARDDAKKWGGKALTGSMKQKEWAEKIRESKVAQLNFASDKECLLAQPAAKHAKFWIDNRFECAEKLTDIAIALNAKGKK